MRGRTRKAKPLPTKDKEPQVETAKPTQIRDDPVRAILSLDLLSRRTQKWPLVPSHLWGHFYDYNWFSQDNPYLSSRSNRYKKHAYSVDTSKQMKINSIDRILKLYPALQVLLLENFGKMALCGGIFTSDWISTSDVDLFFHNCTVSEAETMIRNAVIYLASDPQRAAGVDRVKQHHETNHTYEAQIERRLYVTNVVITIRYLYHGASNFEVRKYQFIHRIYPSLDNIIGGFDLGAAMIAYDGETLWATELGAWCAANKTIIVDLSRRSTTFAQRLEKYKNRDYNILIPGLSKNMTEHGHTPSKAQALKRRAEGIAKLQEVAMEYGIIFKGGFEGYDYNGHHLPPIEDRMTKDLTTHIMGDSSHISRGGYPLFEFEDFSIEPRSHHEYTHIDPMTKRIQETENFRKHDSDYGDSFWIPSYGENGLVKVNASVLANGYLEAATAVIFPSALKVKSPDVIGNLYDNLVKNPVVLYRTLYRDRQDEGLIYRDRDKKRWAEYRNIVHKLDPDELEEAIAILDTRVEANAKIAREKLKGMTWMTQDPQRQWTSSVNPVITDVRKYYGQYYVPCTIGIDREIETCLRCCWKRKNCIVSCLPLDLFKMILRYLVTTYRDRWMTSENVKLSFVDDKPRIGPPVINPIAFPGPVHVPVDPNTNLPVIGPILVHNSEPVNNSVIDLSSLLSFSSNVAPVPVLSDLSLCPPMTSGSTTPINLSEYLKSTTKTQDSETNNAKADKGKEEEDESIVLSPIISPPSSPLSKPKIAYLPEIPDQKFTGTKFTGLGTSTPALSLKSNLPPLIPLDCSPQPSSPFEFQMEELENKKTINEETTEEETIAAKKRIDALWAELEHTSPKLLRGKISFPSSPKYSPRIIPANNSPRYSPSDDSDDEYRADYRNDGHEKDKLEYLDDLDFDVNLNKDEIIRRHNQTLSQGHDQNIRNNRTAGNDDDLYDPRPLNTNSGYDHPTPRISIVDDVPISPNSRTSPDNLINHNGMLKLNPLDKVSYIYIDGELIEIPDDE